MCASYSNDDSIMTLNFNLNVTSIFSIFFSAQAIAQRRVNSCELKCFAPRSYSSWYSQSFLRRRGKMVLRETEAGINNPFKKKSYDSDLRKIRRRFHFCFVTKTVRISVKVIKVTQTTHSRSIKNLLQVTDYAR